MVNLHDGWFAPFAPASNPGADMYVGVKLEIFRWSGMLDDGGVACDKR